MNKKGVFNLVADLLIILIVLFVILSVVYFGLWKKTEDITKEKLPATEKLKALIDKLITSPGSALTQKQGEQADDIAVAIKSTINKMNDIDCVEQIDYDKISDKDFTLFFKQENGENKLEICKMINNPRQCGPIFNRPINIPVYYFTMKGQPSHTEFKIVDNLEKVEFDNNRENIKWFLYKNKAGTIAFFSEEIYNNFKYKQTCSDGTYLVKINDKGLEDYKRVIISESKYTQDKSELDNYRKYLGVWKMEDGGWFYYRGEILWPELMTKPLPFNDKDMADLVNWGMDDKFKIDIE